MRYAVISGRLTISELQNEVKRCGGRNLRTALASKQVFCDLDMATVDKLKARGCIVSKVGGIKAAIMPPVPVTAAPVYSPSQLIEIARVEEVRRLTSPPLYGSGVNLAIVDTGIRETHEQLGGRVVYRRNFTSAPMQDDFDHGTGVASIVVVAAPQCNILNLKVLDDKGVGTEEEVVLAIDHCIELHNTRPEIAPSIINLSLGTPDTGDPNEPLRVAVRAAIDRGICLICAAGNGGPGAGTILSPATEGYARAIGSVSVEPFLVSEFSSRGPTKEGITKPDLVAFGENIITASSKSDTATVAKSGTSFSAPFVSGLDAILQEGMYRQVVVSPELAEAFPMIIDALQVWLTPVAFDPYLSRLAVKPQGVQRGKDNDYGFGLPLGSLIVQVLSPVAVGIPAILTPLIGMMMLGAVMVPITKTFK